MPTNSAKRKLQEASLGEQKIKFRKDDSNVNFLEALREHFPKIVHCGGIEVLRSSCSYKTKMDIIWPPANGYTARFTSGISGIGQAMCYIRPVQRDLDTLPDMEVSSEDTTETCLDVTLRFLSHSCQQKPRKDEALFPVMMKACLLTTIGVLERQYKAYFTDDWHISDQL